MSVLNQIAHYQNRRDEVPNQELARKLVETRDEKGIQEIAENLCITERTVKFHISNIFNKTGAKNRMELLLVLSKNEE